jgi:hypothetical protein
MTEKETPSPTQGPALKGSGTATKTRLQYTRCRNPLRARRVAAQRLEGGDPWRRTDPGVRGYPEAAAHLLGHGYTPAPNIPAMREMWKSGPETRALARIIAERWAVS